MKFIAALVLALALFVSVQTSGLASASDTAPPDPNITTGPGGLKSKNHGAVERRVNSFDKEQNLLEIPGEKPKTFPVTVWVNVPRLKGSADAFRIYPYPIKPPKAKRSYSPMTLDYNAVKDSLWANGYQARSTLSNKAYPSVSFRFNYCLDAAIRESGLGKPHLITEASSWVEEIYPYMRKNMARWNEAEEARQDRYDKFIQFYEDNHAEAEVEAARRDLNPITLDMRLYHLSLRQAVTNLPAGTWYVVGTRTLVGTIYYWNEAFEVGEGKVANIQLNEANALLIDSNAW